MRRLSIVTVVVVALALLITWIARRTYWTEEFVPSPLKGEAASNPFYAAERLVELLGGRARWRQQLQPLPPTNTVIVISSWNWDLIPARREALERWVAGGGRLVLDRSVLSKRRLEQWSGIDSYGALRSSRLPSWRHELYHVTLALRVPIDEGSVTVVGGGEPYLKRALLDRDQAMLFVASTQMRAGDEFLFLSDSTGVSLLAVIWSHAAPAITLALVLVGLAIWRASIRFGPLAPQLDPTRRSLAEQIRGTGRFTVKFGGGLPLHAAVVRALNEAAALQIPRYDRLPAQERVAAVSRVAGLDTTEVAHAMNYAGPRRPGELRSALAVLELVQRALSLAGARTRTTQTRTNHQEGSHAG
jgi:hypothetical protein